MLKCGLDGYFFIRFLRAIIVIFMPLMVVLVIVLLPINYNQGKGDRYDINSDLQWNVTGLDTLSWQNVAPAKTNRYWAHLVCAIMVISWSLYRMYREKVNFIDVRQRFLTSPEHRLKASAKTGTYFQALHAAIMLCLELFKKFCVFLLRIRASCIHF
jgi:hypothetical protein